jgi:hypothetical protein
VKIILMGTDFVPERFRGWRILSAVEVEYPHADLPAGRDRRAAPPALTRLPEWVAENPQYARTPQALEEFRRLLADFIEANRGADGAGKLVINLNGRTQALPFDYVRAIWDVFRRKAPNDPIEVVVFANLSA